jgi:hypothetical protein
MDPELVARIQEIEALSPLPILEVVEPEVLLAAGPFVVEYQGVSTPGAGLIFNPGDGKLIWQGDFRVDMRAADDVRILGNTLQIGTGELKTIIRPFRPEDVVILTAPPPDFGDALNELMLVLTGRAA